MSRNNKCSFENTFTDEITGESFAIDDGGEKFCSSWGIVAGSAVGLIGGAASARSARKAGELQAETSKDVAEMNLQAGRESNALQAAALRQQLLTSAPSYYGGNVALSALMGGVGLKPLQAPGSIPGQVQGRMQHGGMPRTGDQGVATFTDAAGNLVDAQGFPVQVSQPDNTYGIGNIYYGPDQGTLNEAAGQFAGRFNEEFTGQDLYRDPSYQFRVNEGERLMRARQAASGNRFSGQAMKDITNYGQEAASQEYGNAYNRFMQNRAVLYDRLANLAGIGSGAGNAMNAATSSAASNIGSTTVGTTGTAGNLLAGGAAANAAGMVGSTNALVGGVNSGLNNYFTMTYLRGNQGSKGAGGVGGNTRGFDPYSIPGYYGGDEGE